MMSVPNSIAKMIVLNQMHPVTAWRQYYGMSKETLAEHLQLCVDEIIKIESSNRHLKPDYLIKLSKVFGIYPQALNIRYNSYN